MSVRERASGIKNNAGFVKKKYAKLCGKSRCGTRVPRRVGASPGPGCVVSEASGGVVGGRTFLPLTPL